MNGGKISISKYGFSMLQIETMSVCNMQCKFCGYPFRRDKGAVLPEEIVFGLIDSIAATDSLRYICFSQFNEPLLDKRIYKFIDFAKKRKLPVMIITNGTLFNSEDVIAKLIESDPDCIKVSLQVLNEDLFLSVRKAGCDYHSYKKGIFDFLAAAQHGRSQVVVDVACNFLSGFKKIKRLLGLEYGDPCAYDTIDGLRPDMKNFLREMESRVPSYEYNDAGVDSFLGSVGSNYLDEPGLTLAKNISLKVKPFIYGRRIKEFYPINKKGVCASKILGILATGSVAPCCMIYDDDFSLGNIRKDSLETILDRSSGLLHDMRTKGSSLPQTCRHCLGAPTMRGALLKNIKYFFERRAGK